MSKIPLNPDDFEPIRIRLEVTNNTTGTDFRKDVLVRLVQFADRELVLEAPPKSCATGQQLSVRLFLKSVTPPEEIEFRCTVKVEDVKSPGAGAPDVITVSLVQYQSNTWERLTRVFAERQSEILDFLAAARGY